MAHSPKQKVIENRRVHGFGFISGKFTHRDDSIGERGRLLIEKHKLIP